MSKQLGIKFADADDYHSEENKALMRAGIGLNDSNRFTWLKELRSLLLDWHHRGVNGVLACSALKQKYRHLLNSGLSYETTNDSDAQVETDINGNIILSEPIDLGLVFVLLDVERDVIERRIRARTNHDIIRDVAILDSQFSTLEKPSATDHNCNDNSTLVLVGPGDNDTDTDNNGSYLCREKSNSNHTSYLLYVLKYSKQRTVAEIAQQIVKFLPKLNDI